MKKIFCSTVLIASLIVAVQTSSCKGKEKNATTEPTVVTKDTTTPPPPAPVVISPDEQLTKDVKDATKDFPKVTATINNGEITLTGEITRDKLPTLMMALNSLHPKKINNNLTIKK